jgi:tetratricopeptide (TPR) repeat protein
MDLITLLSARRELDRDAAPIDDIAAAERDLLSSREEPDSAWIQGAGRVIAAHQREGRGERVWPLLRVLEPLLGKLTDGDAGRVIATMAAQALLEGDAEAFLDRTRRAAEVLDRAGEKAASSIEWAAHGGAQLALGVADEAARALDMAITEASRAGLVIATAAARLDRARLHLRSGAVEDARASAEAAVQGFASSGDRRMEGSARAVLATTLALLKNNTESLAEARRAAAALTSDPERALAAAALARAHLAAGNPTDAIAALEGAPASSIGWLTGGAAPVLLTLADARAAAGDAAGSAAATNDAKRAVLAFASKLRNPSVRRSYLERIPEHRRALGV